MIHAAAKFGNLERVFADESRPLLQGARLTAWELDRLGIPHFVICDSAAAGLIRGGEVDAVITGADRIAANGDTANKVGTLGLATSCAAAGVPFYIAAPTSTFDFSIAGGGEIEIEMRGEGEIRGWGDCRWTLPNTPALNPAFDVTPAEYIRGIITEKGIIENPTAEKIAEIVGG